MFICRSMQCWNIVCDSGTQPIRNKMGSGAWLGLGDETFGQYTHTFVCVLAHEWCMMWRLEPYFNDNDGF